jgi:hypothetical protein
MTFDGSVKSHGRDLRSGTSGITEFFKTFEASGAQIPFKNDVNTSENDFRYRK